MNEPTEDELAVGQMHLAAEKLNGEIRKVVERGITVSISSLAIDTFGRVSVPVVHINAEKRQSIRGIVISKDDES